jgi:Lon-like ATP-dependent protease
MNMGDVLIEVRFKPMVTIVPVDNIEDVLKLALVPENTDGFLTKLRKMAMRSTELLAETPVINQTAA